MIKDYDQEFGPGGVFTWPSSIDVAERFIEAALYTKSSAECLDNDFFYRYLNCLDKHLFDEYPEDEADELVEAAAKSREELFKEAKNWPLLYLVASSIYKILSIKAERIHMISSLWDCFFWPFLSFDEPLFGMLKAKGWDKIYRNEIREGFKLQLRFEIRGATGIKLMWGSDKDKPWFTCEGFASHIYPEDVLRCLDLVGIDPGPAQLAVDKVFKLQSLIPFYDVLSDNSFSTPATVVRRRHRGADGRGEEGETESPNKPSASLRIHALKIIFGTLLLVGAVIAFTRPRSSRSYRNSIPLAQIGQIAQTEQRKSRPCFATMNLKWGCIPIPRRENQSAPVGGSSRRSQPEPIRSVTVSSSDQGCSGSLSAAVKSTATFPKRCMSKAMVTAAERSVRRTTKKRWEVCKTLHSHPLEDQSSFESSGEPAEQSQPLIKEKSVAGLFRQALSDAKTKAQKIGVKLHTTILERTGGWVQNGRIFTDDSPEVKKFLADLDAQGRRLPDDTSLCLHAQRTARGAKAKVTTQGTVTGYVDQKVVRKLVAEHFVLNGQSVEMGDVHESDHVWGANLAKVSNLRAGRDCSRTVQLLTNIHAIRTAAFAKNPPRYDLRDLRKSLSEVLEPTREADRVVWWDKKNRQAIFEANLTQKFIDERYKGAHYYEVDRMTHDLLYVKGFHPRQATAFVIDAILRESMVASINTFARGAIEPTELEDQSVVNKFDPLQRRSAKMCYAEKVRLSNVRRLSNYFSKCTKLADHLELYSKSSEDRTEDGNRSQTMQHRETKMKAIRGYEEALRSGLERGLTGKSLSEKDDVEANIDGMLANAGVERDGTSGTVIAGWSRTPERVKEEVDHHIATICSIGEGLKIDNLYKKESAFTIVEPEAEESKRLYEECVQSAATKPKEISTSSQQEASDQDDRYL